MKLFLISIFVLFSFQVLAKSKPLIYCSEGNPATMNPMMSTDGTTILLTAHFFNRLLAYSDKGDKLVPELAKSWKFSKDGKKLTFQLRKNVQFHTTSYFKPTRTMTAKDVKFSYDRALYKNHPYNKINGGDYSIFYASQLDKIIKEVKATDNYTVEFILTRPHAPLLANLTHHSMAIHSAEYADQLVQQKKMENIDNFPIGTGPFAFKRFVQDQFVRYATHKKYFMKDIKISGIVASIIPDSNVRFQKLKMGECDIIGKPSPTSLDQIKKHPKLRAIKQGGANIGFVAMNLKRKPFDNPLVRRALNLAVNRKSYITAVYLNNAVPAVNPIGPSSWAYNHDIQPYEFNIKKAKRLLKKAGYPNGFETTMMTLPIDRPYIPDGKKLGEMIQYDLAKIGVKIKLLTYDWGTYLDKAKNKKHDMVQLGWMNSSPDPDTFFSNNLFCEIDWNLSSWCNPKADKALHQARVETDQKKRIELYKLAQKIFHKDAPWIPIAHGNYTIGMRKELKGVRFSSFGIDNYDETVKP